MIKVKLLRKTDTHISEKQPTYTSKEE